MTAHVFDSFDCHFVTPYILLWKPLAPSTEDIFDTFPPPKAHTAGREVTPQF
jgi:hypothetical protein